MKTNFAIRDIVHFVKWADVKKAIKYYYPHDKNNYEPLFYALGKMPKVKTKAGERLHVRGGLDLSVYESDKQLQKYLDEYLADLKSGEESQYYSIDMITDEPEPYDHGRMKTYGISFIRWKYLASMPIDHETFSYFTMRDIIAHFIWEITFYGDEKETKKIAKDLAKRVKDIEAGKGTTVPFKNPLKK